MMLVFVRVVVMVMVVIVLIFLVGKSFRSFQLLIAVDMFIIRTWCAWTWTTSNAALALRMDLHVSANVSAVHFTCIFI